VAHHAKAKPLFPASGGGVRGNRAKRAPLGAKNAANG